MDINYPYSKVLGKRLKEIREKEQIKRPDFVKRVNDLIPPDEKVEHFPDLKIETLKAWEDGKNTLNLDYLPVICEVLNCDYSYFLDENRIAKKSYVQDIMNYTGLSEAAVNSLHEMYKLFRNYQDNRENLSAEVCDYLDDFYDYLYEIYDIFLKNKNLSNIVHAYNNYLVLKFEYDNYTEEKFEKECEELSDILDIDVDMPPDNCILIPDSDFDYRSEKRESYENAQYRFLKAIERCFFPE